MWWVEGYKNSKREPHLLDVAPAIHDQCRSRGPCIKLPLLQQLYSKFNFRKTKSWQSASAVNQGRS